MTTAEMDKCELQTRCKSSVYACIHYRGNCWSYGSDTKSHLFVKGGKLEAGKHENHGNVQIPVFIYPPKMKTLCRKQEF